MFSIKNKAFTPHNMTLSHDGISMLSLLYLEVVTIAHVIRLHCVLLFMKWGLWNDGLTKVSPECLNDLPSSSHVVVFQ